MNSFKLPSALESRLLQRWPALAAVSAWLVGMLCWPSRFEDPQVERELTVDYGRRFADFRRAALVFGTLIWACALTQVFCYRAAAVASCSLLPVRMLAGTTYDEAAHHDNTTGFDRGSR
ncbi:hypothetical protein SB861_47295 [Paraburkholderia sp. SIMBA_049]